MSNSPRLTQTDYAIMKAQLDLESQEVEKQKKEIKGIMARIAQLEQSENNRRVGTSQSGAPSGVPQKYLFERKVLITLVSCYISTLWQELLNLPPVSNVAAGICVFAVINQLTEPFHDHFAFYIDGLKNRLNPFIKQCFIYMHNFCLMLLGFLKKAIALIIAMSDNIAHLSYAIYMKLTCKLVSISAILALVAHWVNPEYFGTTDVLNKVAGLRTSYEVDAKMRGFAEDPYVQCGLSIFVTLLGIGMTHIAASAIIGRFSSTKSPTATA